MAVIEATIATAAAALAAPAFTVRNVTSPICPHCLILMWFECAAVLIVLYRVTRVCDLSVFALCSSSIS